MQQSPDTSLFAWGLWCDYAEPLEVTKDAKYSYGLFASSTRDFARCSNVVFSSSKPKHIKDEKVTQVCSSSVRVHSSGRLILTANTMSVSTHWTVPQQLIKGSAQRWHGVVHCHAIRRPCTLASHRALCTVVCRYILLGQDQREVSLVTPCSTFC